MTMKRVHRSLLIGSSILVLPQLASASLLLAGWHDFDASTAPEYLDQNTTGFSGTVTKGLSLIHISEPTRPY